MTKVVDLFSGMGGFSLAATMAGCKVIAAYNHWPVAVETHAANHPGALHVCQDLQQQNWYEVPGMDLLLASWACQGHSRARGKDQPRHDTARATAWAFISAVEACNPEAAIGENVPDFLRWPLYGAWVAALNALGRSVSVHLSDAADHGVPQNRERVFIVVTKSKHPLVLNVPKRDHVPASSFIDFGTGSWSPVNKPGRAEKTLARIASGRKAHGSRFLTPYYGSGSGTTGRSLNRPIGTITTRARWALVDGDWMRMLTLKESRAAMGFPPETILPANPVTALHMLGNAVAPLQGCDYITALRAAI